MKYIDADRLRKEIEFAKSVYSHPNRVTHGVADAFRQDGRAAMCDDILKKIDSIQQERPDVDLEKEIEKEWKECDPIDEGMGVETANIHIEAFDIIAHHFYELGLNTRKL